MYFAKEKTLQRPGEGLLKLLHQATSYYIKNRFKISKEWQQIL